MYFKIKLFFRQQPKANFYFSQPYFESYDGVLTIDAQFMCSMISLIYLSIKFVNQLVPKYINKGNGSRIKTHSTTGTWQWKSPCFCPRGLERESCERLVTRYNFLPSHSAVRGVNQEPLSSAAKNHLPGFPAIRIGSNFSLFHWKHALLRRRRVDQQHKYNTRRDKIYWMAHFRGKFTGIELRVSWFHE